MRVTLIFLSTIIGISGVVLYAISIVKGKTRPHRMTRFILFFILTLNFVSIVAAKGNLGAVIYAGLTCAYGGILFAMSLWRGMGGKNRLDFICLGIASLGIIGWKLTGNAIVGVWFAILADLAAYIPAFVKTWEFPETESHWLYTLSIFAAGLGLFAYPIEAQSIFQIYIVVASAAMLVVIYHKQIAKLTGSKA
mgnify:CR=1 FL=1